MLDREERFSILRMVKVIHKKKDQVANAVNLSPSGACLVGIGRVTTGTPLTIQYRDLSIQAKVVWCSETFTGVRFLVPLTQKELELFRDASESHSGEIGSDHLALADG